MISKFEIHKQVVQTNSSVSFYDVMKRYVELSSLDTFVFVDGGAGIGKVGNSVKKICDSQGQACQIHFVEPLPENIQVLKANYQIPNYHIHDVAISDKNGEAQFSVPNRRKSAQGKWLKGSSTGGTLVNDKNIKDHINVKVAKLEDIISDQVNVLKMDLQGAEYYALQGYQSKLAGVDIIYMEHTIRRNLEKVLKIIPDNFIPVYDTFMAGVVGKHIPIDVMRAEGLQIDMASLGVFGHQAIVRGHFTDERWDLSNWEVEQKLNREIRRFKLCWMALDIFFVNKGLPFQKELFHLESEQPTVKGH